MKKRRLLTKVILITLFFTLFSANITGQTVKGKVSDTTNEPLIGATIKELGTTNGVIADLDGNFSIKVSKPDATLEVSYIGYTTVKLPLKGQTSVTVRLESDTKKLDEVIVVGYGTQKKATLTGAVTAIKAEELMTTKSSRLVDNLQGKVSGLQIRANNGEPGTFNYKMQIRGFGNPIIVIDGVIRDGIRDFSSLNPDDIESVSVLKDASAAVYGMNSDNGVIVVTTRKGQSGKARVTYNGNYGAAVPTDMPTYMSSYDYFVLRNEMDRNDRVAPRVSDADLAKYQAATEPGYLNTNWFDLLLKKNANQYNHMVNIEGGSNEVTYFISGAAATDDGLLKSGVSNYKRYNFRGSFSAKLSKNLVADVNMNGKADYYSQPQNSFIWFYQPLVMAPRYQGPFVVGKGEPYVAKLDNNLINPWPLAQTDYDGTNTWRNTQYQSTVTFTYTVPQIKGLVLKTLGAFDGNSRFAEITKKGYQTYDYYTAAPVGILGIPSVRYTMNMFTRTNLNAQAMYNTVIASDHNISANLVYEMRQLTGESSIAQGNFSGVFTNPIIDQTDRTNLARVVGGTKYTERFAAYIGKFNYDYKSKYLLDVAFRYDGSYRYAPDKRWSLFPSLSGGWRVSEEDFIKENLPFLSNLKFRGSWGKIGRDAGRAFNYIPSYSIDNRGYTFDGSTLTTGFAPAGLINYGLTWIQTQTTNLGVDVDLWHGKLGFAVDVFQKIREGLLDTRSGAAPNTLGASFPQENLNSDAFKGIELSISHRNKINDFEYAVSANATYARQQIIKKDRAPYANSHARWMDDKADGRYIGRGFVLHQTGQFTSLSEIAEAPLYGGSLGNSYVLPGAYILEDMDGNGKIDGNDERYAIWTSEAPGFNADPLNIPLQFGMNISMNYKNFDLNLLLQGASLFYINARNGLNLFSHHMVANLRTMYMDRWHTVSVTDDPFDPNTQWNPGQWPALYSFDGRPGRLDHANTTVWTTDATYMRLKNIELGYNLPKSMLKALNLQKLRMYVNGFNLLTFKSKVFRDLQLDPEKEEGRYGSGLEYPLMKTINLGVNLSF